MESNGLSFIFSSGRGPAQQPIWAGLALARERGIGATSRRAGFSFPVASAATTTRRSPRYHHPSNIWLAGYHSVSISIRFRSASLWWSHSQSSSALPLSPFSAHIHALCCGAVVYNFLLSQSIIVFPILFHHGYGGSNGYYKCSQHIFNR